VLWVATVAIGSGLLFGVQPLIARMLLPRVGGAPAAWTTCVLFFQAALLAGYAYAHWVGRRPRGAQLAIHAVLLVMPLAVLPFRLVEGAPGTGPLAPTFWLLKALVLAIGLPFLVLAAGAPLFQRWLSASRRPEAADPYFLYAASNVGSLLALSAYPVLIEPALGLERQSILWAAGYVVYLMLALGCAVHAWRARAPIAVEDRDAAAETEALRPGTGRRLWWVALSAAPSSLMLGVTSVLTADVAAMPFLWILPLALYLLTFVFAFARRPLLPSGLWARLPIAAVVFLVLWMTKATEPLAIVVPAYLAVFFIAAMACHTELARLRPDPRHLTTFYLLVGLGGVVGGTFNSLLAPALFDDWTEVPLAFTLVCLVIATVRREERVKWIDFAIPLGLGLSTLLLSRLGDVLGGSGQVRDVLSAGIPALLAFLASNRRIRFGLAVGAVLCAGSLDTALRGRAQLVDRSFFGVHRVTRIASADDGPPLAWHKLYHGSTVHGAQRVDAASGRPVDAREPLGYYSAGSPIGRLFRSFREGARPERVGLVGLGAGSLLAYAEPGQRWTVFEIDPLVKRIAENERYFTYLPEARKRAVEADIVLGDARLTLGSAAAGFDVLVLDAFTSGAIPVHLLTREAFGLYEDKLGPEGLLAFHISNRHLDLAPLLRAMAKDLGLAVVIEEDAAPVQSPTSAPHLGSRWAFLARSSEVLRARGFLLPVFIRVRGESASSSGRARVWTDDESDLWSLFQW
jgi:hypothetical protein